MVTCLRLNITIYVYLHTAPGIAPDNVVATALNATAIHLSWNLVSTENGVVREYVIKILEVNTSIATEARTNETSIVIPVHPAYLYNCSVSAFTVGTGPFSTVVSVGTPEDGINSDYWCMHRTVFLSFYF